jgi:AmmeMemoRadiSam system protein A
MTDTAAAAPGLDPEVARLLLDLAVDGIRRALLTGRREAPDVASLPAALQAPGATFVTLRRDERLLGCIGTLVAYQPLAVDVVVHGCNAAFDDPRMPPIDVDDFCAMCVHVSVLGPLRRLDVGSHPETVAALRPGADGVLVESAGRRGTLLPSVWAQLPTSEQFVQALWRKAGLRPGAWSAGTRVSVYSVAECTDPGPRSL